MAKAMLDAVKTAKSIHEGDYSSLRGKSFLICDKIKNNKGRSKHVKKHKSKYTLDQVCTKLDQIGDALFAFIKTTNTRFDGIDARLDNIEARLDYNGLKKLPKSK